MRRFIFALVLLSGLFSVGAQAQNASDSAANKTMPANFKSDGCSMFPDGCYTDCCVAHDVDYYGGGRWKARWRADKRLFKCVASKKGWWHKPLAPVIWAGVRVGGLPFLPTSFRWGFGAKKNKKKAAETKPKTERNERNKENKKDDSKPIGKIFDAGRNRSDDLNKQ